MQFGLSESQKILQSNARKFFAAECPMADVRRIMETDTAHDEKLWHHMAEQGFLGVVIPEDAGGMGLGMVELAALAEEMGRALVPGAFISNLLAASAIHAAGSKKHLAEIASGKTKATLALLESSAKWDADAVEMSGLKGEKMFVPDAGIADVIVVAARDRGELALYAVDGKSATKTPMPSMDLTRRLYKIDFSGGGELLARGDAARKALDRALDIGTVALCAEITGGMQRTMEIAVEYAKTRKQFGKPIGQYQAVQHQCADMLLWTESSRSAALYAAWALENGVPDARAAVSVAKVYASDACREVGNRGVQVQGGMGFTWENDTHLYYRRAKASEIAFGDASFHRERIAKLVVDHQRREAVNV
ncbi:MAG TPA: acyl-CoA dehydrogenase family protein [Bryobacteraceae bacterium]|nr:acyl-CoA dehydrogenase family protein [Bryobacteraceae bacterium]